jgi:ABC-2 type transport system permease protein
MRSLLLVAHREYLDQVRTKGFWIGVIIFPVVLGAVAVAPRLLEKTKAARHFAVIDHSGWVLDSIRPQLRSVSDRFALVDSLDGRSEAELTDLVRSDRLFAYFVVGADPVDSAGDSRYVSKNLADDDLLDWFRTQTTQLVQARRIERQAIDPAVAEWLRAPVAFESRRVTATGGQSAVGLTDKLRQIAPIAFVYLLWITIFSSAGRLMTTTIEEKSNRIVEMLLASVSPFELMAGKVVGAAATGLTLVGSWILALVFVIRGLPAAIGAGNLDLTPLIEDPRYLASFVVYFLLGYLFFAALLVGIGSVCSEIRDAQNLMQPVMLMLFIPLITMVPIGRDPNGLLARVLSYIPPFTPFVMMNRAAGPPSTLEYVLTTVVLLAGVWAAMWAAAKVFRVGILLTGKRPTLPEILRWVRAPVGSLGGVGR